MAYIIPLMNFNQLYYQNHNNIKDKKITLLTITMHRYNIYSIHTFNYNDLMLMKLFKSLMLIIHYFIVFYHFQ